MGAVVTEGEVRAGGPMTVEHPMVPTRSSIAYDGPSATTGKSDAAPTVRAIPSSLECSLGQIVRRPLEVRSHTNAPAASIGNKNPPLREWATPYPCRAERVTQG